MRSFFQKNVDVLIVFVFMAAIFSFIVFFSVSDMPDHAYFARRMLADKKMFSGNFLMYVVINLFSGFRGTIHSTKAALVVLLGLSNAVKYVLVRNEFAKALSMGKAKMVSLSLLFVFIIPILYFLKPFELFLSNNTIDFGYYVPNVWHNSTVICMMPFAVITYFLSVRQFEEYDNKRNGLITLFVALGVMVKPSFFFIYGVAYPVCIFAKYKIGRQFVYSLIPVVMGCLCALYEYLTIYDGGDGSDVVISIAPLFTLEFWQSHWLYFTVSMAFPAIYLLLYWKETVGDLKFWFVLIMLVMAVGIRWCCHETGEREMHGNFTWQVVPAMWFVFYFMIERTMKQHCLRQKIECCSPAFEGVIWKEWVFVFLYGLHVVMGVVYLIKYLITGGYWWIL